LGLLLVNCACNFSMAAAWVLEVAVVVVVDIEEDLAAADGVGFDMLAAVARAGSPALTALGCATTSAVDMAGFSPLSYCMVGAMGNLDKMCRLILFCIPAWYYLANLALAQTLARPFSIRSFLSRDSYSRGVAQHLNTAKHFPLIVARRATPADVKVWRTW
jgi:hypothetical protein